MLSPVRIGLALDLDMGATLFLDALFFGAVDVFNY